MYIDSVLADYGIDRIKHVRGSTTDAGPEVKRVGKVLMGKVRAKADLPLIVVSLILGHLIGRASY